MTEQEIINVLKENKTKGVAYMFLPPKIQNWIVKNYSKTLFLQVDGTWESTAKLIPYVQESIFPCQIFCLSEDYELQTADNEYGKLKQLENRRKQ